ncbi:MAG: 3-oxoacyl-ACP reductase family protein [Pyrinomonadaceae bacterium]
MKELEKKVAFVTGGSRGIGEAIAVKLAENGADIVITYVSSAERAEEVVEKIESFGVRGLAIKADAFEAENVIEAVKKAAEEFGKIDILVNNAGILELNHVSESTLEDFDRMINVNVRAVFAATIEAVKTMPENGRIITIGSGSGDQALLPTASLYSMSKAAVKLLTKGWARDLGGKNITANIIQPGPVDTDMNPADGEFSEMFSSMTALGRYGKGEEIADLTAFLASPRANYITGATINIDGGLSA